MKMLNRNYLAFLLLAFIVGCAQLGLNQAKDTKSRIAYAESSLQAVNQSLTAALKAGPEKGGVSAQKGAEYVASANAAYDALLSARAALAAGNEPGALGYLQAATSLLTSLQAHFPALSK